MAKSTDGLAWRFTGPEVHGLRGPVGDVLWLGFSLADQQERAVLEAGLRMVDPDTVEHQGGWLLVRDDVAINRDAVTAFLEVVGDEDSHWYLGGRSGQFGREIGFDDSVPWLVWLAPGGEISMERIQQTKPIEVDPQERTIHYPISVNGRPTIVELPLTSRVVLPTSHWVQLLWANLLGLAPYLWRRLVGKNAVDILFTVLKAIIRTRSTDPFRIATRLGRMGTGCQIHPSAVVEGCWLGDNVHIGANAVVRGCVLADDVSVEDLALVEFSVLGGGGTIQRKAMCKFSVVSKGGAVAGAIQLGVMGTHSSIKRGAFLMDMALGKDVRIEVDGALQPAPLGLVGVCLGAGTVVGAGVKVAAGRVIPSNLQIVSGADVVTQVPKDASGRFIVANGTLEPL